MPQTIVNLGKHFWKVYCPNVKGDYREKITEYQTISLISEGEMVLLDKSIMLSVPVSTINKSFEEKHYCAVVFLGVSQVFDKVWHEILLYKLKMNLPELTSMKLR